MGEILSTLQKMAMPGVSGLELDKEAERLIYAAGGEPAFKGYQTHKNDIPFPGTICFSLNEEVVHGIPTAEKIIKDGDIVSIDIGMRYPKTTGFLTDTAVTFTVGEVDPKIIELLRVTKQALEVGIKQVKIGSSIFAIGEAIENYINSQGKYGIVRDLVGHGVGHAVHEEPRVPNYTDESLKKWIIEPGVVIAIEPMVTLGSYEVDTAADGWGIVARDGSLSAHFEHTVIVNEDGSVVATRRPGE